MTMPHTVEKSGTYTNEDKTVSTQLTEGDVISDEDAVAYGLMSQKAADKAAEAGTPAAAPEIKNVGAAPENKAK
jgi:hypothetical protein